MNSHTTYFLCGGISFARDFIKRSFENKHIVEIIYESISIDQARELRLKLLEKSDENTVFLVRIEKISIESQTVLLKVCEDFSHITFCFSYPESIALLDTLLSRGEYSREETKQFHFDESLYGKFIASSFEDRCAVFTMLQKKNPDTEPRILFRQLMEDFIFKMSEDKIYFKSQDKIYTQCLHLLSFQKSSPKQIFEYFALMVKN